MKKVALFFHSFHGGGVEKVMYNLAIQFAKLGLDVQLVLIEPGVWFSSLEIPDSIKVFFLESKRSVYALPKLTHYLRINRPDILISGHTGLNVLASVAVWLSGNRIKHIITEHSPISRNISSMSCLKRTLLPTAVRIAYRRRHCIVAVSNDVRSDLMMLSGLSENQISVIHNPVLNDDFSRKVNEHVDHQWFRDNIPVILGVGRLTPQKDFGTLIRAFALVRSEVPARLVILGEGDERKNLEALVADLGLQDSVELLGYVPNPYPYMAAATVFVLSSIFEGFGNVIVEALAAGTPVVSTDCEGGPKDILDCGKYGRLVPVGNPSQLAEAIIGVIKNRTQSDLSVLKGRAQMFTSHHVARQYMDLFS